MAGLLAHGSRPFRQPSQRAARQWRCGGGLTVYSCGGSRGVEPRSLFIFHLEEPSAPAYTRRVPDSQKGGSLPHLTLVLGGARSGKSRHAESLFHPGPRTYIATAQAFDDEMRARIAAHRADRADAGWSTIEEPIDLVAALAVPQPVLVDCLTLWVSNLLLADLPIPSLDAALAARTHDTVLVSNEVGLGIVPDNALARRFRDDAGRLHQHLATLADTVTFVVAGIPQKLK